MIFSSSYPISPSNLPCTESHLSRCARVCVSVRSFTARTRSTCFCDMARRTLRPMRPKPLIAKLVIGKFEFEELNRYAEKLQRPTGVLSVHACRICSHVERNISDHWLALCQTTNLRFFASLRMIRNAYE